MFTHIALSPTLMSEFGDKGLRILSIHLMLQSLKTERKQKLKLMKRYGWQLPLNVINKRDK